MMYMAKMEISTNVACRVQCDFCPQELLIERYSTNNNLENISYGQPAQMSFDTFKKCLSTIPKSVIISFAGYTEPWLNPDCSKMIVYAYEKGHQIEVFSTLVGMKLNDVELIKHVKFDVFHLHLPDEENIAKIAVNSDYQDVLKKVLANIPNVSGMSMGNVHPKIKEIIKSGILADEMNNRAGNVTFLKPNTKKFGPLVCNRDTKSDLLDIVNDNVLLPNGDVSLCCNDYGLQNIIGNLLELNYDSLFTNDKYQEFHKKLKSQDSNVICRHCNEAVPQSELTNKQKLKLHVKNNLKNKVTNQLIELYQDYLFRFPDIDGFNYFYDRLTNNELSLLDVKQMLKKSSEYKSIHPIKIMNRDKK